MLWLEPGGERVWYKAIFYSPKQAFSPGELGILLWDGGWRLTAAFQMTEITAASDSRPAKDVSVLSVAVPRFLISAPKFLIPEQATKWKLRSVSVRSTVVPGDLKV